MGKNLVITNLFLFDWNPHCLVDHHYPSWRRTEVSLLDRGFSSNKVSCFGSSASPGPFQPYFFKSTLSFANSMPSSSSRTRCFSAPPGRGLILPCELIMRCHGTSSGQAAIAPPTQRGLNAL